MPQVSWNLLEDLRQLLSFPFMVNAFRAGTIVAILAGLVGWLMVLRRQSFVGHTLALVGFPGAAGAILVGASATAGFFVFTAVAALVIAAVPAQRVSEQSALTGTVQAVALAFGFLFVSLYGGFLGGANSLLFGTFLGVSSGQVAVLAAVAAAALAVLAVVTRPLFFASLDPDVARARGVPVGRLSIAFLLILGVAAAEVSQITGTLLVFTLLVVPAATAQTVTARPGLSVALTVAWGVTVTWLSLAIAYFSPYPLGFILTSLSFAGYVAARLVRRWRGAVP